MFRVICHLDMDAFYASVEQRDNPALRGTDDRRVLRACLREQASDISARMKRRRLGARTVQVKLRYGDFTTLTRQITVEEPLTEANDIYRLGGWLLGREKLVSHSSELRNHR